nr:hypothetical transcript [Hymenolepis microstoma]
MSEENSETGSYEIPSCRHTVSSAEPPSLPPPPPPPSTEDAVSIQLPRRIATSGDEPDDSLPDRRDKCPRASEIVCRICLYAVASLICLLGCGIFVWFFPFVLNENTSQTSLLPVWIGEISKFLIE